VSATAIPRRANISFAPHARFPGPWFEQAWIHGLSIRRPSIRGACIRPELQLIQQLRVMVLSASTRYESGSEEASPDPSNCRMLSIAVTRCSSSAVWRGV